MISIIIPSRNEKYLFKTINDIFKKAIGDIEVIAVLDGYWPPAEEISTDDKIRYIHITEPRGMRNAINMGVNLARGEYLFKTDAHCLFGKGFDQILKESHQDNWVSVPRRYRLDPEKWEIIEDGRLPIDYMYLDIGLHGRIWAEKNTDIKLREKKIDDLMSSQGSAWFMKKSYYKELELLDEENYGTFYNEFQEIGLKCWFSGGRVVINKNTFYAHWHKDKESGRGYRLDNINEVKGRVATNRWKQKGWHKQTKPLSWLINKFSPVPSWT